MVWHGQFEASFLPNTAAICWPQGDGKALAWTASYRPLHLSTHSCSNPIYTSRSLHLCFARSISHPYNQTGYCTLPLLLESFSLHGEARHPCHSTKYEGRKFPRIMLDTGARGRPPMDRVFTNRACAVPQPVLGSALETGSSGPEPCWGVSQQFDDTGQLHTSVQKSVVACADRAF